MATILFRRNTQLLFLKATASFFLFFIFISHYYFSVWVWISSPLSQNCSEAWMWPFTLIPRKTFYHRSDLTFFLTEATGENVLTQQREVTCSRVTHPNCHLWPAATAPVSHTRHLARQINAQAIRKQRRSCTQTHTRVSPWATLKPTPVRFAVCLWRLNVWSDRLDFLISRESLSPVQFTQLSPVHQSHTLSNQLKERVLVSTLLGAEQTGVSWNSFNNSDTPFWHPSSTRTSKLVLRNIFLIISLFLLEDALPWAQQRARLWPWRHSQSFSHKLSKTHPSYVNSDTPTHQKGTRLPIFPYMDTDTSTFPYMDSMTCLHFCI